MTDLACRTCGSSLAADQRYCLQCGNRVADARLPFLDLLAGGRPPAPAPPPPPRSRLRRMGANTIAVAGVGCLLLALGVGVLIGNAGDGGSANASPQVISVGGVAPAAAATPATGTTADGGAATDTATTKTAKKKKRAASSASPAVRTKATNKALKNLDGTSGSDYQKKASKLPKTVGTGGKAPPKDKKPAAGGGSFQEIG